jgi:hypothetical protein
LTDTTPVPLRQSIEKKNEKREVVEEWEMVEESEWEEINMPKATEMTR